MPNGKSNLGITPACNSPPVCFDYRKVAVVAVALDKPLPPQGLICFQIKCADSGEADQCSVRMSISLPGDSDQGIGAQRRWRSDCGGSDRNRQAEGWVAIRSEAKAGFSERSEAGD